MGVGVMDKRCAKRAPRWTAGVGGGEKTRVCAVCHARARGGGRTWRETSRKEEGPEARREEEDTREGTVEERSDPLPGHDLARGVPAPRVVEDAGVGRRHLVIR